MKNLKRVLSLGLASVMLLGMMVMGASAAETKEFTDASEIQKTEAVTTMAALNVINGKDNGSFDPDGNVTRGEMAKMITILLNGGQEPVLAVGSTPKFSDVTTHWARKYIEYCAGEQQGVIAGRGDGTFAPDANVTGTEAAKMVLTALGYNSTIFKFTGVDWALNVNAWANGPDAQLYTELKNIDPSAPLSRENAAQMLFNALDAKIVETTYQITSNGTETGYKISDSETMMTEKFNATKYEGVVTGNEVSNLEGGNGKDGETVITIAKINGVEPAKDNTTVTVAASTGADALGRSVSVYVKNNSKKSAKEMVGNIVVSTDNEVYTNTSGKALAEIDDDIKAADLKEASGHINYGEKVTVEAGKTLDETLGVAAGKTTIMVDNNADGKIEYVFVVESALEQVTKVDTKNKKTTFDVTATEGGSKAWENKNLVGADDVEKGDYVLTTKIGSKLYVEEPETFEGTATGYKLKEGKTSSLTIDGTKYDVAKAAGLTKTLTAATDYTTLKKEATFYKDAVGNIVAVGNIGADAAAQYAISWGGAGGNVLDDNRVKLTLEDGSTNTYTIASSSDLAIGGTGEHAGEVFDDGENAIGALVAYNIKSNGQVELSHPAAAVEKAAGKDEATTETIKFTANKAVVTVGDETVTSTKSTVFFYVKLNKAGNRVSEVEVLTGYNNATGVSAAKSVVASIKNDAAEAVAFVNTKEGGSSKNTITKHLWLIEMGDTTSDGVTASVYLAGSDEAETIDLEKKVSKTAGLYLYTVDNKGVYTLTGFSNEEGYKTGVISRVVDDIIVVGGKQYTMTKDTLVIDAWDEDANDGAGKTVKAEAVLGGTVARWDDVKFIVDDDDNVVTIAITGNKKSENIAEVTIAAGKDVIKDGDTTQYTLTVKGEANEDGAVEIEKGDSVTLTVRCSALKDEDKGDTVVITYDTDKTIEVFFDETGSKDVIIPIVNDNVEISNFAIKTA